MISFNVGGDGQLYYLSIDGILRRLRFTDTPLNNQPLNANIVHEYKNGTCTGCGTTQPAPVITALTVSIPSEQFAEATVILKVDGYGLSYQWFYRCAGDAAFRVSACTTDAFRTVMSSDLNGCQVYCVVTDDAGNSVTSDIAVLTLSEEDPSPARIPGDLNGDGKVNNKDLTRLFQFLSGYDAKLF